MSEGEADDPVAYFLEDMTYHGKADRTREAYGRVLEEFETFLAERDETPSSAGHRDCMAYVHSLRGDVAESTVASYAAYLHRFYAYMAQVGRFDANPMALVMEELDERIETDPTRREIPLEEMRAFVAGIAHPLHRAVVLTLLKTGMRAGELCNLDRRDLSLSLLEDVLEPRPALDGRGDALYVSPEPTAGEATDGEERTASNKRQRATVVPVDDELGVALARWFAARPDPVPDTDPLLASTSERWGARLTPHMVHHVVERHARDRGWYREGGGSEENVTPHYFRHYFTTHMRDRTGDRGVVKYLRGDVAGDVIDTYTHNWGDRVREVYEANVYRLVTRHDK